MADFLKKDIVPVIPLRGSISASGDLILLAYIAGALQGKRSIAVWPRNGSCRVVTAEVALEESSLQSLELMLKEGLAIVNGTAVSAGVAALAMHNANGLAFLSQPSP